MLRLLDGGRRALVRFTRRPGVPVVVLAEELEPEALVAPEPIPSSSAAHTGGSTGSAVPRSTPRDPAGDRQALEALRLGVVPPGGLDSLTVGREVELHALDRLIADWLSPTSSARWALVRLPSFCSSIRMRRSWR